MRKGSICVSVIHCHDLPDGYRRRRESDGRRRGRLENRCDHLRDCWPSGKYHFSPLQGDLNALIASCSEYTFLITRKRIDGTMFSCTSLGVKIDGGIGTALAGWLLAVSGYAANEKLKNA